MMHTIDQFLTVGEIAQALKLNPLTIYEYIRSKKLGAIRFGRYYRVPRRELHMFLESQKVR